MADRDKGVITLDQEGEVINTFCKDPLRTPQDVAVDDKGAIIACDLATGDVVYVGADDKKCDSVERWCGGQTPIFCVI